MRVTCGGGTLSDSERTFEYAKLMAQFAAKAAWMSPETPKIVILGGGLGRMTWALEGALLTEGVLKAEIHVIENDEVMLTNMLKPIAICPPIHYEVTIHPIGALKYMKQSGDVDVIMYDLFKDISAYMPDELIYLCQEKSVVTYMNVILQEQINHIDNLLGGINLVHGSMFADDNRIISF